MRFLAWGFLFVIPVSGQISSPYQLDLLLPTDAVSTLAYSNGLVNQKTNWAVADTIATGSFFGVQAFLRLPTGAFQYVCGMAPSNVTVNLLPQNGSPISLTLSRRPDGFGRNPPPGCDMLVGVLPRDTPPGSADLVLSYGAIRVTTGIRVVVDYAELFTPLDLQLSKPFLGGETVTLRANGIGSALEDMQIVAGGIATAVTARQPDPDVPGFEQFSFVMPAEAAENCYLPAYLATPNGATASVFLPKANQAGACKHPWGLDEAALKTLDRGERIWLTQPTISVFQQDGVVNVAASLQHANIWRAQLLAAPEDSRVCRFRRGAELAVTQAELANTFGDAGSPITVTRPDGFPREMYPVLLNYTTKFTTLDAYSGDWKLDAPGGTQVGAFSATLTVPPLPVWTPPSTVDRQSPLDVNWSTDSVLAGDRLAIVLQTQPGVYLECRVPAADGTFQIPARYLRAMAPNPQATLGIIVNRPFERKALFPFSALDGTWGTGAFDYQITSTATVPVQ